MRRKKRENQDISKVTFVNYEHKSLTAKQADVAKEQQERGENNRVLISRGTTAAFPWFVVTVSKLSLARQTAVPLKTSECYECLNKWFRCKFESWATQHERQVKRTACYKLPLKGYMKVKGLLRGGSATSTFLLQVL